MVKVSRAHFRSVSKRVLLRESLGFEFDRVKAGDPPPEMFTAFFLRGLGVGRFDLGGKEFPVFP